jgi:hypothetical protein
VKASADGGENACGKVARPDKECGTISAGGRVFRRSTKGTSDAF